jgi:hypothetical protein
MPTDHEDRAEAASRSRSTSVKEKKRGLEATESIPMEVQHDLSKCTYEACFHESRTIQACEKAIQLAAMADERESFLS